MLDFPKSRWINNWGIEKSNAESLHNLIIKNKPKVILETGTFEAQATYVMAQAAHKNNNNCIIYTIDYDGDPTTNLDKDKWLLLKKIREENLNKIKDNFGNVKVNFIDGDSRIVLKELVKNVKKFDLFYQDSMHFFEGIKAEWQIVESNIELNGMVIFDDLKLKGVKAFRDWFKSKYKNQYSYSEINTGHKQFIIKKN